MNFQGTHDRQLADLWIQAVERSEVRAALELVYTHAAAAIAERGPACWASGRCCNFEKTGHRLYVTGLEAAYCVAGQRGASQNRAVDLTRAPALSGATLSEALIRGGCPFQTANLCGVHTLKPLGCRLYFCDRSAQTWQHELSERLLAKIRSLHEQHAIEYRYGEWRAMLAMFLPGA